METLNEMDPMGHMNQPGQKKGVNSGVIRICALLLIAVGLIGWVLQNGFLHVNEVASQEELLNNMEQYRGVTTLALVLQALEACAVPLIAMLAVEGILHTSCAWKYAVRVALAAVVSEVPFDMVFRAKYLDMTIQNPVFGVLIAVVVLYFMKRYAGGGAKKTIIKILAVAAAIVWIQAMRVYYGLPVLVMALVLWGFRNQPMYRNLAGVGAAAVLSMASPFMLAMPFSLILIHFYNGEEGHTPKIVNYLAYPVMALIFGLITMFL